MTYSKWLLIGLILLSPVLTRAACTPTDDFIAQPGTLQWENTDPPTGKFTLLTFTAYNVPWGADVQYRVIVKQNGTVVGRFYGNQQNTPIQAYYTSPGGDLSFEFSRCHSGSWVAYTNSVAYPEITSGHTRSSVYGAYSALTVAFGPDIDPHYTLIPYDVVLKNVVIRNTRSFHEDTDFATLSVNVAGKQYPVVFKSFGDVNNGTHDINLVVPILVPTSFDFGASNAPVVIRWNVVNNGNSNNQAQYQNAVQTTGGVIVDQNVDGTLASVIKAIFNAVVGDLFKSCDGPVVEQSFSTTANAIPGNTTGHSWTIQRNDKKPNPGGLCRESDYDSTIEIRRHIP